MHIIKYLFFIILMCNSAARDKIKIIPISTIWFRPYYNITGITESQNHRITEKKLIFIII